jgi:hypothetical protein
MIKHGALSGALTTDRTITVMPDYNPASPWLVGPILTEGYCLGEQDCENFDRYIWVDFAAPIVSGREITLLLDTNHSGPVLVSKILEFTRDDTPWLVCYGTRDLSKIVAIPLEHPRLKVLAIGARVASLKVPRAAPSRRIPDDDIWRHLDPLGRPALKEWRKRGFPPQKRLPVINHQSNIDMLRDSLCLPSSTPISLPPITSRVPALATRFSQTTSMRLQHLLSRAS